MEEFEKRCSRERAGAVTVQETWCGLEKFARPDPAAEVAEVLNVVAPGGPLASPHCI